MVRRLLAQVQAAEGEVGAAVGEVLHVGGNEAEHLQVPVGHARKVDGLQDDVAEPHDARRLDGRAHRAIHARPVLGGVGDPRRAPRAAAAAPTWLCPCSSQTLRPDGSNSSMPRPPAGYRLGRELARPELLDVAVEVGVVRHPERRADEAVARPLHGDRDAGRGTRAAGHQALGGRC